jgi:hypothetical protein
MNAERPPEIGLTGHGDRWVAIVGTPVCAAERGPASRSDVADAPTPSRRHVDHAFSTNDNYAASPIGSSE